MISLVRPKDCVAETQLMRTASEKREDSVHAHGAESKKWIKHLFPSAETLDKVGRVSPCCSSWEYEGSR